MCQHGHNIDATVKKEMCSAWDIPFPCSHYLAVLPLGHLGAYVARNIMVWIVATLDDL